jgi:hypothetical protein
MKNQSKIRITINYGYDLHSLELFEKEFKKIQKGEYLKIIGQGFSVEGEMTQDTWIFKDGKISIDCDDSRNVFSGRIEDILGYKDGKLGQF